MLSQFLEKNKIIFGLSASSISDALEKMIRKSSEPDQETVVKEIMDREHAMSTALGKGIALPRAHIRGKEKSEVIVGISPQGIDARGFDLIPIKIIILFLFSPNEDHAAILAESLQMLNDDTVRAELLEAGSEEDLIARIRCWEEEA